MNSDDQVCGVSAMARSNQPKPHSRRWRWVAAAVIVGSGALAAWGAWTRTRAGQEKIRQMAEVNLRAGRYKQAEAALNRLRDLTPHDYLLRAQMARGLRRPDQALAELAKIPNEHPAAARARLLAGQIQLRQDRIRLATAALQAALALDPTLVQAHRELVFIDGILLRRHELNEHFQALSRLVPMTFDELFSWCLTRSTVWEPYERAQVLRRFVAADPDDRWSRAALAETLRQIGRTDEAMSLLAVLPESDPDARAVRARIALDQGDDRAADAILAEGPADHSELALLRGQFALAHGDGQAAVRHFRAAYSALPDDRDTVFGLGTALALVGDHAAAAPFLRDARAYDTLGALLTRAANRANRKDAGLMRALGAACEAVRRLPEARGWYNLAVQTDPLDEGAQQALYRLRTPAAPSTSVPGARTTTPDADQRSPLGAEPAAPICPSFCCLYHCCHAWRLSG
jgi:tetratricopeptide (TPR) repeat protein